MRILYRALQLWHSLTDVPTAEDLANAGQVLSEPLMTIFSTLQPAEQAHGLWIYLVRIWQRVAIVLRSSILPERIKHWSRADPSSWKHPFVVAERHAD